MIALSGGNPGLRCGRLAAATLEYMALAGGLAVATASSDDVMKRVCKTIAILSGLLVTFTAASSILRWTQGKDLPLPKGGYASGILDGKLVLAGGTYWKDNQKLWLDEVVAYDPSRDTWEKLPPLPRLLAYGASATFQETFYVLGGAGPEKPDRAGYRLEKQAGKYGWSEFTPLPADRCYAKAVVAGDRLYLIAGSENANDLSTATRSLLSVGLSEKHPQWKTLAPIPGEGRAIHAVAACKGSIFVFGGCYSDGQGIHNLASAYRYDPSSDRWTRLKDAPAPVRAWSASSPDDRIIFLFAGFASPTPSDPSIPQAGQFERRVYRYDTVSDEYQEVAPLPHAVADIAFHYLRGAFYGSGGEPRGRARTGHTYVGRF